MNLMALGCRSLLANEDADLLMWLLIPVLHVVHYVKVGLCKYSTAWLSGTRTEVIAYGHAQWACSRGQPLLLEGRKEVLHLFQPREGRKEGRKYLTFKGP